VGMVIVTVSHISHDGGPLIGYAFCVSFSFICVE